MLRARKFITDGEHLELRAITKEQSGSYECIASNDISTPDTRTVQVIVNYPPSISKARSTGTPVGQKGVLHCEAAAVPRPDFEWYKEDRRRVAPPPSTALIKRPLASLVFLIHRDASGRLLNGLNRVKIENQGKISTLVFFNVSEEDYGNYTPRGPGAMHAVNSASLSPRGARSLLLTLALWYLLRF
ncbi:hypothetical protein CRUP_001364 [Coryphaenoides rupestris]|nr:hypothetical protein CRUP_001364 [Coryphaenoides rupestris]